MPVGTIGPKAEGSKNTVGILFHFLNLALSTEIQIAATRALKVSTEEILLLLLI